MPDTFCLCAPATPPENQTLVKSAVGNIYLYPVSWGLAGTTLSFELLEKRQNFFPGCHQFAKLSNLLKASL